MTENDMEMIRIIRSSKDPAKAMEVALAMLSRCATGESMESIAASYGIMMTAEGRFEKG